MKKTAQRLIDAPLVPAIGSLVLGGGGAGGVLANVFATPVANSLLLLDSSAQFPMSTFKANGASFLLVGANTNLPIGRTLVGGAGLTATDGGAGGSYTLDVVSGNDAIVVNADNIVVALAVPSGLQTTGGLALADSIAGAGLTISGKVLDVVSGNDAIVVNANNLVLTLAVPSGLQTTGGLALADSIAGDGLTISSKVLNVVAGDGLTVAANAIALTTPGTLSVSSNNAAAGNHTHQITASSAPGAASALLKTDAAGGIQLDTNLLYVDGTNDRVGIGTTPSVKLHVESATEQLRVGYSATVYASHTVASNGVYTIGQTGGASDNLVLAPDGNLILNPNNGATIGDVLPNLNYRVNLGSPTKQWLSIHAAELWIQTLVAEDVIATVGGRIWVTPTTTLTRDLASGDTTIYVKHNQMQAGDVVILKKANLTGYGAGTPLAQVEFLQIDSAYAVVTGTPPDTEFSYTVIRNLDGTGANQWYAGDALANTGTTGSGFHEIYSGESILSVPFDAIFSERTDTGAFSDNYAPFKEWTPFASSTATVNDAVYFGVVGANYSSVYFYLSRAMIFTGTILLEYWNASTLAWVSLGDVTTTFTSTGFKHLSFSPGSLPNWGTRVVNGVTAYWVRTRISAVSSFGAVYPLVSGRRAYHEKNQWGPTWVVWHRNSTTFNDFTERLAAGQLRGLYDYSASTYGFAAGRYAATYPWVALDDANGLRIMRHNTQMAQWDTGGNILVGQVAAGQSNVVITSGAIRLRNNTTTYLLLDSVGALLVGQTGAGQSNVYIDAGSVLLRNDTTAFVTLTTSGEVMVGRSGASQSNVYISAGEIQLRNNTTAYVSLSSAGDILVGRTGASQGNVFITSGAVKVRLNTTDLIAMTTGGVLTVGEVGSGKPNVEITATSVALRVNTSNRILLDNNSTITLYDSSGFARVELSSGGTLTLSDAGGVGRIQLTAAGTLSINDDGGNNMIVFDSSGNSYFAGVMTIGTSGEIRQGTGTLGSNFTGLRIWRDTDVGRIGGYNSNTLQWYADTTGRLYAGGGAVLLDAAGVSLRAAAVTVSSQETISWYTSLPTGGTYKGGIYLVTAAITLVPTLTIETVSGHISMDALTVGLSGDLNVLGGINVGTATAAGNGQIKTSGRVSPGGTTTNGGQLFATHTTGVTGGAGATNLITAVGSEVTLYVINGISTTSGTRRFGDLVFAGAGINGDLTPFKSITAGTPATRTYDFSGSNLRVALTGSTDVYAITVLALGSNEN